MLPGIYIMTNKWGREGEGRRQRQREEEGREREIDWEGEKEIKRERGKWGRDGRKERGRAGNENCIIQFHICTMCFKFF